MAGARSAPQPLPTLQESRPVPDPTALTTEALHREIASLKELLQSDHNAMREFLNEKLRIMESSRVEQKKDTKDALDAALTAQKEAVKEQTAASDRAIAKSEAGTTKQIDQQGTLLATTKATIDDKIEDVKERQTATDNRLTAIEGRTQGVGQSWTVLVSIAALGIAALGSLTSVAVAIGTAFLKH
jgi:hypothetical protein